MDGQRIEVTTEYRSATHPSVSTTTYESEDSHHSPPLITHTTTGSVEWSELRTPLQAPIVDARIEDKAAQLTVSKLLQLLAQTNEESAQYVYGSRAKLAMLIDMLADKTAHTAERFEAREMELEAELSAMSLYVHELTATYDQVLQQLQHEGFAAKNQQLVMEVQQVEMQAEAHISVSRLEAVLREQEAIAKEDTLHMEALTADKDCELLTVQRKLNDQQQTTEGVINGSLRLEHQLRVQVGLVRELETEMAKQSEAYTVVQQLAIGLEKANQKGSTLLAAHAEELTNNRHRVASAEETAATITLQNANLECQLENTSGELTELKLFRENWVLELRDELNVKEMQVRELTGQLDNERHQNLLLEEEHVEMQAEAHIQVTRLEAALQECEADARDSVVMQTLWAKNKALEAAILDKDKRVGQLEEELVLLASVHERNVDKAVSGLKSALFQTENKVKTLQAQLAEKDGQQGRIKRSFEERQALDEQLSRSEASSSTAAWEQQQTALSLATEQLSKSEIAVSELQWQLRMREEEASIIQQETVRLVQEHADGTKHSEQLQATVKELREKLDDTEYKLWLKEEESVTKPGSEGRKFMAALQAAKLKQRPALVHGANGEDATNRGTQAKESNQRFAALAAFFSSSSGN